MPLLPLLLATLALLATSAHPGCRPGPDPDPAATCVDLRLRTCADAAYNRTAFPTPLEHRSWEVVESSPEYMLLGVLHFLLEGQCNPDLRLLGCSVLAPR
uniref:Carboxypeptidase Z n=1 Tax=Nannospalax galili TaxID=1026970 RepID=A0A8C6QW34_NANGA